MKMPTEEQMRDVFKAGKLTDVLATKIPEGQGFGPKDMADLMFIAFKLGVRKGIEYANNYEESSDEVH